jgi:acyl-CoA thioester hydrolase
MKQEVDPWFKYPHRVTYYETDAMGVVHHSNHIKYFEEARVAWLRDRSLIEIHQPYGPLVFAVIKLETKYFKPARFDDELEIWTQARQVGARLEFQYAIWSKRIEVVIAIGHTLLAPIDVNFRVAKLPAQAQQIFANESWSETWPPVRK